MEKQYYAAEAKRITDADAVVAGPELERITARENATAWDVVRAAEPLASPLHRFFEWDNVKAAEKHRLQQAGDLLRSIRIRILDDGREVEDKPLFVSFEVAEKDDPQFSGFAALHPYLQKGDSQHRRSIYVPIDRVLSDEALIKRAIGDAKKELAAWRRRWIERRGFRDTFQKRFQPVLEAIEKIEREREEVAA